MAIDLSSAIAAEMLVNRLSLTDDAVLVLQDADPSLGYVDILSLTNNDSWDALDVENIQNNKEFYQIRVLDFPDFEGYLNKSSDVVLEGYRYKIERVYPPKGATRVWHIRCSRIGKSANT